MISRVATALLLGATTLGAQVAPSFSQAGSSPTALGTGGIADVELADLDGNGSPDVAVANGTWTSPNGGVDVYLQSGSGVFGSLSVGLTGTSTLVQDVDAFDVDGDGITDLVAMSGLAQDLDVWLGTGMGSFTTGPSQTVTTASYNDSYSMVPCDVDGDFDIDLITLGEVRTNNGSGTFAETQALSVGGATLFAPMAGDIDRDGDVDAVVTYSDNLGVFTNNGSGTFSTASTVTVGTGASAAVDMADIDLDGDVDAAVAQPFGFFGSPSGTGSYNVVLNNGSGGFSAQGLTLMGSVLTDNTLGIRTLDLTDINGDLYPDMTVPASDTVPAGGGNYAMTATVIVATGDGTGAFGNFTRYDGTTVTSGSVNITTRCAAVADMDQDDLPDVVYAESNFTTSPHRLREFLSTAAGGWFDAGAERMGSYGPPLFLATGSLSTTVAPTFSLNLSHAKPSSNGALFLGISRNYPPATWHLGANLVPIPLGSSAGTTLITTTGSGTYVISASGSSLPSGARIYMQYWIQDGNALGGYSVSNALVEVIP